MIEQSPRVVRRPATRPKCVMEDRQILQSRPPYQFDGENLWETASDATSRSWSTGSCGDCSDARRARRC